MIEYFIFRLSNPIETFDTVQQMMAAMDFVLISVSHVDRSFRQSHT